MADGVRQVHHERSHARWSASSTAANVACAGRLALIERVQPTDEESEAAAWGTACHSVSETCLRSGKDASDYIGTTEKTKRFSFEVDDEMAETAQMYVGYIRRRMAEYKAETGDDTMLWVEQAFSLASLNPPIEAGGTGDAVIWYPEWRLLEIVDLKGGRGVVVEAKGNPQLRTYGLGAVLANPGLPVEKVVVTIVQPRAPHKDGRIRSEEFHVADLVEWTSDLLDAMRRSAEAIDALETAPSLPAWGAQYLTPGDHCDKSFCPVRAQCPALEQKVMDSIGVWFDDHDQPKLANTPDSMAPEQLAQTLDLADMIESWVSAVRARAHSLAELGTEIPGYILVEKEGREKFQDGADEQVVTACRAAGLGEAKFLNAPKLRTPKQIRDALTKFGAKDVAEALKPLSGTAKTGTNLVRSDKTSRPAATPAVARFLETET